MAAATAISELLKTFLLYPFIPAPSGRVFWLTFDKDCFYVI